MKNIEVKLDKNSYQIYIEKGLISKLSDYIDVTKKTLFVTDEGVPKKYLEAAIKGFKSAAVAIIDSGEESKSIDNYVRLNSILLDNNFTREDQIGAVGGGVAGDLSGFVASTYMRGISFYNIPTTLLSQVDSSIGGKTAINFGGIKNLVGSFYQPKAVLIDEAVLDTLNNTEFTSGLAEAIKMAACFDKDLFELIENNNARDIAEEIIYRSLLIKKDVVEKDEKEKGLRRVLNFGHTIGHGIEVLSNTPHGHAIALGMLFMCSKEVEERLLKVYTKEGIPNYINLDKNKLIEILKHDKKCVDDKIYAIYVDKIGEYRIELKSIEEVCEGV